jgi:hypothetical protein
MDFATSRRLYGGGVFAIPHARHLLAGAFADLMMCDSLSVVASRSLHVTPDQMSVHSAIVKYLLPTMAERIINDAATVLGARHYLREQHCYGIFEKILRDYPLVGLGHAGKFLCLQTIAAQLPHLVAAGPPANLFNLAAPLPEFDASALRLTTRSNAAVGGLDAARAQLSELAPTLDRGVLTALESGVAMLHQARADLAAAVASLSPRAAAAMEPAAYQLAENYCRLHAGIVSLQLWLANRQRLPGVFAEGRWLAVGLARIGTALRLRCELPPGLINDLAADLSALHTARQSCSIVPITLA